MEKITVVSTETFFDYRGYLSSMWRNSTFPLPFVEDRLSVSRENTLRGLHGDKITGKLFIPIQGTYTFYARSVLGDDTIFLDNWSADNNTAIYVPPNYLNGHLCRTSNCIMMYKWTQEYMGPEAQFTVRYDDLTLGIDWKVKDPILSDRDKNGITFLELREQYGQ